MTRVLRRRSRRQAAVEHEALVVAARALAFLYGGTRPEQYEDPEDKIACAAMHVAYAALGQ